MVVGAATGSGAVRLTTAKAAAVAIATTATAAATQARGLRRRGRRRWTRPAVRRWAGLSTVSPDKPADSRAWAIFSRSSAISSSVTSVASASAAAASGSARKDGIPIGRDNGLPSGRAAARTGRQADRATSFRL